MDNNKKYYTAADYSRYHRGEMSAAEMHKMERAALQDPFVQDALDGYIHTNTGEADVTLLRKRIAEVENKETAASSNSYKNWWKIAAVVLIAVTISFLIYNSNDNEVVPKMADMETEEATITDSGLTNPIAQANPTTTTIDDGNSTGTVVTNGDEVVSSPKIQAALAGKNIGKDIVKTKAVEKVDGKYKVDGTIVTVEGLPLTNASIVSGDKKILAKTDDQGKFEFESIKSDASTTIINEGYQARQKTLNANQSATVVMKEEVQMANVPNNAAKQKVQLSAPVAANNIAQPTNGWDEYNKYLRESTPVVYNEAGVKQTGNVLLSFEVDRVGMAEKISIKKSDCNDCNLAAMQLLKDGPRWIGKSGVVNEISVKF